MKKKIEGLLLKIEGLVVKIKKDKENKRGERSLAPH